MLYQNIFCKINYRIQKRKSDENFWIPHPTTSFAQSVYKKSSDKHFEIYTESDTLCIYSPSGVGSLSLKTDIKPFPNDISAEQAYRLGYDLVVDRTKTLLEAYNKLSACFEDYGVKCLRYTFQVQLQAFFLRYDPKFKPHESIMLFDYPILSDISQLQGIEAFEMYFKCLCFEQAELARIGIDAVKEKLHGYHRDYSNLYENIYWIVFRHDYPFW